MNINRHTPTHAMQAIGGSFGPADIIFIPCGKITFPVWLCIQYDDDDERYYHIAIVKYL